MARLRRHLDSKTVQIEKLRLDLERALSQGGAEGDEGSSQADYQNSGSRRRRIGSSGIRGEREGWSNRRYSDTGQEYAEAGWSGTSESGDESRVDGSDSELQRQRALMRLEDELSELRAANDRAASARVRRASRNDQRISDSFHRSSSAEPTGCLRVKWRATADSDSLSHLELKGRAVMVLTCCPLIGRKKQGARARICLSACSNGSSATITGCHAPATITGTILASPCSRS